MDAPQTGDIIDNRYQVMSILGTGGFSIVYLARDVETGLVVAVKLLLFDDSNQTKWELAHARFQREMQVSGRLDHPNIVRLVGSGRYGPHQLYAAFEYIEGVTLKALLKREEVLDPVTSKGLMMEVLAALASAHRRGIVHRDLKPDNIMITQTYGKRHAVVLDFGIASVIQDARDDSFVQLTKTGSLIGTPYYMSPEQIRGQLTHQTDLYAWGLIFLECITGERAITSRTGYAALTEQISAEPIPIPPLVLAHPFGAIIQRAVSKPLHTRIATAHEALMWLDAADPRPIIL